METDAVLNGYLCVTGHGSAFYIFSRFLLQLTAELPHPWGLLSGVRNTKSPLSSSRQTGLLSRRLLTLVSSFFFGGLHCAAAVSQMNVCVL